LWVERLGALVRIRVWSFNLKPGWAAIPDFELDRPAKNIGFRAFLGFSGSICGISARFGGILRDLVKRERKVRDAVGFVKKSGF
jgi:hypothetical protein